MNVEITLAEGMLGTASNRPEIYREYLESKRPPDVAGGAEVLTLPVEEALDNATTVFHRHPDTKLPMIYDYQIKGFFKDACGALSRVKTTESSKVKAYKKIIDGTVFVNPRMITLELPHEHFLTICERPLRAQTAQGERIALARSEEAPAGTVLKCEIVLLDPGIESLVTEWLNYGALRGLGQWRNSGKGRFSWKAMA